MTLLDLLHALGVLGLGALGWVTLAFVGSPVREFYTMRREVRRLMLLHWDDDYAEDWEGLDPEAIPNRRSARDSARAAFKELASRIGSFDQGEPIASWFVRRLGFNLPKAAGNLRHISVWFGANGEERDGTFKKLDAALRFKANPKKPAYYNPHNIGR
jgi:hypothetical protein